MNKAELVAALAEKLGGTKADATKALDGVFDVIADAVAKGDEVKIPGFGAFAVKETAEKQGRNPRTGESVTIPAGKAPKFKPATELKRKVSGETASA